MITKEEYLQNPCAVWATAFWKSTYFPIPENIVVVHEKNYKAKWNEKIKKYFRLIHDLKQIESINNENYRIETVDLKKDLTTVSTILEECYHAKYELEEIIKWTNYRVFDQELWIFILENKTNKPVALGIAFYDSDILEGALEWIQVIPKYRKLGLGQMLVNELLIRLKHKAKF